ncbi:MAG: cytochrome C oxidase subunit IV family protein [Halobacteriales archaeon]
MTSLRVYTAVYVALMVLAVSKVVFGELFDYWTAAGAILLAAVAKTALIAGVFQHLKDEPRSVTWLVLISLAGVVLLAAAAAYSIS